MWLEAGKCPCETDIAMLNQPQPQLGNFGKGGKRDPPPSQAARGDHVPPRTGCLGVPGVGGHTWGPPSRPSGPHFGYRLQHWSGTEGHGKGKKQHGGQRRLLRGDAAASANITSKSPPHTHQGNGEGRKRLRCTPALGTRSRGDEPSLGIPQE